jgi:hypothetical protein
METGTATSNLVTILKTCAWCKKVEFTTVEPEWAELVRSQSLCWSCYEASNDARDDT